MEYKSCHLLEHGICFYNHNLCSCCYAPLDGLDKVPFFLPVYRGSNIDLNFYKKRINFYRENAKQNKYLKACKYCYHLELKDWEEEYYIDQIYITHFEACNANCIYCINNLFPNERHNKVYKVIPVLDDLKEKGLLRSNCEFHIGGGEFTLYPECDELLEKYIISGFSNHLAVATNGIKYSNALFKAMEIGRASIIISLDCGSRNLFKKIKRVDAFNNIISNLKLYTSTELSLEHTFLKYIVIPNINDNKNEFQKFLNIAKKFNIKGIKIDLEGHYCRNQNYKIDEKLINFLNDMVERAKKQNFNVEIFQFYKQCLSNN